jgi:hypothetical protein
VFIAARRNSVANFITITERESQYPVNASQGGSRAPPRDVL